MGLLDFLRRKRPADESGGGTGSPTTDSGTMAAATGAAAISPEGDVPPAEHGSGHDAGAGGVDSGAAGDDSGGGVEGGGADYSGGGDSGGPGDSGGGGDAGGGGDSGGGGGG